MFSKAISEVEAKMFEPLVQNESNFDEQMSRMSERSLGTQVEKNRYFAGNKMAKSTDFLKNEEQDPEINDTEQLLRELQ